MPSAIGWDLVRFAEHNSAWEVRAVSSVEEAAALLQPEDDFVLAQGDYRVFVDPFSAQYLSGVTIDYVTSMQGSGFTFKNPNSTGGCGCGSSFTA